MKSSRSKPSDCRQAGRLTDALSSLRPSAFILALHGADDRVEDFHVAGAAAEIAGESLADVGLGRARRTFEEADGGEHHAGRADAALRAAALDQRLLHGVEALAVGDTFDRRDPRALDLRDGDEATIDQLAVEDDGARAAFALAAALLRARELQPLAQRVEQARQRVGFERHGLPVHAVANFLHVLVIKPLTPSLTVGLPPPAQAPP